MIGNPTMKLPQQAHGVNRRPELPLDHAPQKVREHGYRDAHIRPLVSRGKRRDDPFPGSFRVTPQEAWGYPSIELRTGNSWPVLILDCDGPEGTERLIGAITDRSVCCPNWMVTRRRSNGTHAVWTLARPVLRPSRRGPPPRRKPMNALARISEYYAGAVGADTGYTGVLSHNPMAAAHGPGMVTTWSRKEPYTFEDLAEVIPFGWRVPKLKQTAIAKEVDLFEALCKWAGSPRNRGRDLWGVAAILNEQFAEPCRDSTVRRAVKSVERYRERWERDGWCCPAWINRQAARGRRSGLARRKATADRDRAICDAVMGGASIRAVARDHGLWEGSVRHIVNRDLPLWSGGVRNEPTCLVSPRGQPGVEEKRGVR